MLIVANKASGESLYTLLYIETNLEALRKGLVIHLAESGDAPIRVP